MKAIIDGLEISVEGRKTILEAARENGIDIPSLCDHPRMEPYSGCRICLVEIKGRKGYAPACSSYLEEEMVVTSASPQLQTLRRNILQLILAEHPSACLICSEKATCTDRKSTIRKVGEVTGCVLCSNNGRCGLQEVVQALELNTLRFPALYRNIEVRREDPFFDRNYNLCILCGRCIRVCKEIRAASVLSFLNRGPETIVGTPMDRSLLESGCQFCGACVDVCPTGALVERAVRSESLPDRTARSVCPLCSIGCEMEVQIKGERILSTIPAADGKVNQGQACVRGRFGIRELVSSPKRVLKPHIRSGGCHRGLIQASWDEAVASAAARLGACRGEEIAFFLSPQACLEEIYVLLKFAAALGAGQVVKFPSGSILESYRAAVGGHASAAAPPGPVGEISKAKTILILGQDLPVSHPIIWLEVVKAAAAGAQVIVLHPGHTTARLPGSNKVQPRPGSEAWVLGALSKTILEVHENRSDPPALADSEPLAGLKAKDLKSFAKALAGGKPVTVLFGNDFANHGRRAHALREMWNLGRILDARIVPLPQDINERALVELARIFPGMDGNFGNIRRLIAEGRIRTLYAAGSVPGLESERPETVIFQGLHWAERREAADIFLPAASFAECDGSFLDIEGRLQSVHGSIAPAGDSKPGWWIASEIARKMGFEGFDYREAAQVLAEIQNRLSGLDGSGPIDPGIQVREAVPSHASPVNPSQNSDYPFWLLISAGKDRYQGFELSRELRGFQRLRDAGWVYMHPKDARRAKVKDGDGVRLESESGSIDRVVKAAEGLPRGILETTAPGQDAAAHNFVIQGLVPVRLRRRD